MLIKFEDIRIGDELIIPSNSNLKYLKVLKLGKKSHACSFQKGVFEQLGTQYFYQKEQTCEPDVNKHNATFYLKDEGGYKDIWLVKRENND